MNLSDPTQQTSESVRNHIEEFGTPCDGCRVKFHEDNLYTYKPTGERLCLECLDQAIAMDEVMEKENS